LSDMSCRSSMICVDKLAEPARCDTDLNRSGQPISLGRVGWLDDLDNPDPLDDPYGPVVLVKFVNPTWPS